MSSGIHLLSRWDMSTINPLDIGWRGLGNHGVGVGLDPATDIVNGIAGGKATEFNGVNEYITISEQAGSFQFGTNDFSVSAWVKLADVVGAKIIYGQRDSSSDGVVFHTNGANLVFRINAVILTTAAGALEAGRWHHVIGVRDGNLSRIYVDGVADANTGNVTGQSIATITSPRIGERSYLAGFPFAGVIDEVMIFDAALTMTQVVDLYTRTRKGILR